MQRGRVRSAKFMATAIVLCAVTALAATGLAFMLRPTAPPPPPTAYKTSLEMPEQLFREWPKPDLVLLLSAEQHGYLLPCGCSRPQYGGLERRFNLVQLLKQKGWPVVPLDLGDVAQWKDPQKKDRFNQLPNVQGLIKYRYSMEALREMGYLGVGIGKYEANLKLFDVLAEYALNNPSPRVLAANLKDKDEKYPTQTADTVVHKPEGSPLTIGVSGVTGLSVQKTIANDVKDPNVAFEDNGKVLPRVLGELAKQKTDLNVLLYQGTVEEATLLANAQKDVHVILSLSPEDEPRTRPWEVGNSIIIAPGHKGRHVQVVGVYRTGKAEKPYEFRSQLVTLGEEFMTPKEEKERQPILVLMEKYAKELKTENYMARYPQVPHTSQVAVPGKVPTYVGTETCKKCHEPAYDVWKDSKHAHAYETLVKARNPGLRQHDAECIVCHTVGFGYRGGFTSEEKTPKLKDVGCESCHGPCSEHVSDHKNAIWYPIINPWKPAENETPQQKTARMQRIDQFCQECHDIDNDVKYKFEIRWPPVAHPTIQP